MNVVKRFSLTGALIALVGALVLAAVETSLPTVVDASEPTVLPTIKCDATPNCVPYVGETLHADESGIPDAYGLTGVDVEYTYQWVTNDGNTDADIAGATAATYTLAPTEEGKTVKVRMSFTDADGKGQTLTSAATASVRPSKPDLIVEYPGVAPGPNLDPRQSFIFVAYVRNQGGSESVVSSRVHFYYSLDARVSIDDIQQEGYRRVDSLAASATSEVAMTLRAPPRGGTFFYYACVSPLIGIESNTLNNCSSAVAITVAGEAPDLVVRSPSVSESNPQVGESFTLSGTVFNIGDDDSESTTLRFYRSTDASIEASDAEMGTRMVPELAISASSAGAMEVVAPSTPGTYYYGACVDPVGDSDTTNNCSPSVQVEVLKPNSTPTGLPTMTGTAQVGQTLTADTSGIADADGLSNVSYSYQWLSSRDTEIEGATSASTLLK